MGCENCGQCQNSLKKTNRTEKEKDLLIEKLDMIEDKIKEVKQMIENDRYVNDVVVELVDANNELKEIENNILESHMENHVAFEIQSGNLDILREVMELFKKIK